jgi:hypothetical protein
MKGPTRARWRSRVLPAGIAGAFLIGAIAALPSPAQAFWIGFPFPFSGYYPPPYYPPPYYYAPPAAYYPPPAYPAAPGYAAPTEPASAYNQQPAPSAYNEQTAPFAYTSPPSSATPNPAAQITYTNRPAFKNASGQTCREYTTNDASGRAAYGTACQAADGQWRVAN